MCCNNRTHVIVISSMSLGVTGASALWNLLAIVSTLVTEVDNQQSFGGFTGMYGGYLGLTLGILLLVQVLLITSQILSIVGAFNKKQCFLMPFMISLVLLILCIIGLVIFLGVLSGKFPESSDIKTIFTIYIIAFLIALGIPIYFLTMAIKFYNELSSGLVYDVKADMLLSQIYTLPQGGESTIAHGYDPKAGPHGQTQKIEIPYIQME